MKLDNSIAAVVTGGASGLGRASAQALAAAGVKVAIFDINEEAGEALAKELGGVFCNVDILSEESCEAGFAKARAAHGQERIVVHCAVVAGGGKTVGFDKTTGGYKRAPTAGVEKAAQGIFVASYRLDRGARHGQRRSAQRGR
jgi:NAD(P)-dependent dehydrogenase (short-subunit alcohol dehydrogenase family)